ncbi:MAG: Peptidase subtilisin kexin sedolisin [Acidobacteria bacterium]|nr:Peptidase subtilisin kexin sedolisin [Acidobacteriota bacterium]
MARVAAPDAAVLDRPGGAGPFTYEIEALDASGLCAAAPAASNPLVPAGPCRERPVAPAALAASDAETAECGVGLAWSAVGSPCGGAISYRVHRSTDPGFVPGPATLRAETGATAFSDSALTTGWDALGEPAGDSWTYEVRAVDGASGLEGPGTRVTVRAGGPRQAGTWIDDAGDARPTKMTSETTVDETGAGAAWSRSPIAVHHGGNWSYWTDDEPLGTGRYPPLACFGLVGPELALDAASSGRLSFYADYSIEHRWDGMVVELSADGGPFAPIIPIGGYPNTFGNTTPPPCSGDGGGTGAWINGCDYPPTQGCITGPASGGLSGWRKFEFNLASWAGRTIRFRINMSSDCGTDGGAVIDDLAVSGVRVPSACVAGACWPPPRFSGLLAADDLDPATAGAVRLAWGEVVDWGGGGTGSFEVWRDGRLVAALDSSARGYDDHGAEPGRDHAYQVLARSGSGCGLPSASPATLVARDCGALDAGTVADARLTVDRSADGAQVVLRCAPIPGAARYRFPWSLDPATVGSVPSALESSAPEARHPVLRDGASYFYLVQDGPAPGCP